MNGRTRYLAVLMAVGMLIPQIAIASDQGSNEPALIDGMDIGLDVDANIPIGDHVVKKEKEDRTLTGSEEQITASHVLMDTIDTVPGLGNWSFRDVHKITQAEALGYDGEGIVVGIADSGVDFCKSELQESLKTGPDGWPLVMDIASLREYLGRNMITEDSWFADTSFNGSVEGANLPDFEYFHSPHFALNGKADDFNSVDKKFTDAKEVTTTGQFWDGESWVSLDTIGGKDFDLQDLHVSRDGENWYFGFNTRNAQVNRSYGLYLDFDNLTGGANIGPTGVPDPRGNHVDAETAHTSRINSVAYHSNVNGHGLLASCADGILGGSDRECIHIWDEQGNLIRVLSDPTAETDEFKSLAWTPAGDRLIAASRMFTFAWETATWALVGARPISASGLVSFLSVNQDGTRVASANGSRISLFNPADMSFINNPSAGGGTVQNVAFTPSGDRLAVGMNDGYVRIFNSADLTQPAPAFIHEFASSLSGEGHDPISPVKSLAWSPNGAYLATGGDDGRVFIWDSNTGIIAAAWNGTSGRPALSPQGSYAISGIVWDGNRIAVTTGNGTLYVINQAGFAIEKILHNRDSVQISCSRKGIYPNTIFTGSENAAVRLVNMTSSTQSLLNYRPWVLHRPDVVVYADYIAEWYAVDENGLKVIGTPDSLLDPQIYQWISGGWNTSSLSEHGQGLCYYKGNKDISSESEGLTEITSLGFVEIALPRTITDIFGTNSLSVKLFVTGEAHSVAQDTVPTDYNVNYNFPSPVTDFITTETRSLSSYGYVEFPHTTIALTSIQSKSGVYHYGFHPSDSLANYIHKANPAGSDYVGILVVDANTAGDYDTVIIDFNNHSDPAKKTPLPNYIFDDMDPVVTKASPFITIDILNRAGQKIPDGIMDYSAGLVYHISDGNPLPYSTRLRDLEVMRFSDENPMPIPGKGDIVCFFGEFETYFDGNEELMKNTGTIGASAIGSRAVFEDPAGFGLLAGAATGVKIAAVGRADNYFQSSIRFLAEGHDGTPGTGDDCSIVYVGAINSAYTGGLDSRSHFLDYMAVDYLNGNVTFILPAGNDGPGMGTVASPSPRNALVVGSSSDNAYDQNDNPEHIYGNVAQWSSRGPTPSGYPKPDIIASGIGRFSEPLTSFNTPGGSTANVQTFKDSRIAAAISAGVAAQVQQAFLLKHGRLPDMYETIGILKSSAADLGYDVLVQGAGLLDALEAVRMASDTSGVMYNGIDMAPSNYWSQEYQAFPRVMGQGSVAEASISIRNTGSGASIEYLAERHGAVWTQIEEFLSTENVLLNLTEVMPLNVTYLKVTAITEASDFFKENMEPNNIVNKAFIISDWSRDSDPFPEYEDMNILSQAEQDKNDQVLTNVIELEVGQPHQKFGTNIWFALNAESSSDWKIVITGYTPASWDWITLEEAPAALLLGENGNISITAGVPQDALPGTYSGSMRVLSDMATITDEVLYTPPPGSMAEVTYEEVGITNGSCVGTLANGNLIEGTVELVQTQLLSYRQEAWRGNGTDNNAAFNMSGQESTPWAFQIPPPEGMPGLPNGTPIFDVEVSWYYYCPGYDEYYWTNVEAPGPIGGNDIPKFRDVDYFVESMIGGFVTFVGDNWTCSDGLIGNAYPREFYVNYTYLVQSVSAINPGNYTVDITNGTILFDSPIDTGVIVNITANYTHIVGGFQRLRLESDRVSDGLVLTLFNVITSETQTVPESEYEFEPLTGVVRFHQSQMAIFIVNATYSHYRSTAIIPIVINVGAAQVPSYTIGGDANSWINSPTTMNGGYNFGLNDFGGDRRYFYFSVPEQGLYLNSENFRSVFNLVWDDVPTDIDISVYSEDDNFISLSDKVGPYILKETGKGPVSPSPAFFTTSSGGANESISFALAHGLNVICLRAKLLSGTEYRHAISGSGGLLTFTGEKDRAISTNQLQGSLPIQVKSNLDMERGFFASVLGPAIGKTYTAEEVYPDEIYVDITQEDWWRINSGAKYSKLIDVPEGTLSLDVHIIGYENCPDLDLCLFYDGKNGQEDGVAQWDEFIDRTVCEDIDNYGWGGIGTNFKTYAYSAGAGSDEATKVLKPKPGVWIVKVVGYEVSGNPGNFDLIIKMIKDGVKGYGISSGLQDSDAAENALCHSTAVPAHTLLDFGIDWNLPILTSEDGGYSGVMTLGNVYSRDMLTIPIEIYLDRVGPALTNFYPNQNQHLNDPGGSVYCMFSDEGLGQIDKAAIRFFMDSTDVTHQASISVPYAKNSIGAYGHWTGSVIWSSPSGLSEGGHTASVIAGDMSGNILNFTWGFTVDSQMPGLRLDPADETIYVNTAEVMLDGWCEPGAEITVSASCNYTLQSYQDGSFGIRMALTEGENGLVVSSRDFAGNSYAIEKTVVLDRESPGFSMVHSSMGTVTRYGYTEIYGKVTEAGSLLIGGNAVTLNSDLSFSAIQPLSEGMNGISLDFRDLAGNTCNSTINVTMDTVMPSVSLGQIPAVTESQTLNISGTCEADCLLYINGKPVETAQSRQESATFASSVTLSPGMNRIVITARDRAGNTAEEILMIEYKDDAVLSRNYAAIGMMAVLIILGFILGLLLMGYMANRDSRESQDLPAEEMPEDSEVPADAHPEIEGQPGESLVAEEIAEDAGPEESYTKPEPLPEQPADAGSESLAEQPEQASGEPSKEAEPPKSEDPRIAKLQQAYESGKMSKELYEKNLKRFRGD